MYESLRSTVEKCVCVCVTILTKPNRHKFEERNDAGSHWVIKLGAPRKAARIKQNNLQINPKHLRLQLTMTIVLDQCQLYNIYIYILSLSIYMCVHTINIIYTAYSTMFSFLLPSLRTFFKKCCGSPPLSERHSTNSFRSHRGLRTGPRKPCAMRSAMQRHAQPPWRIPW